MIPETGTEPITPPLARTNLPIPLTTFVGRQAEIARIRDLLANVRLVTLTGAGGSGKTRLALQVASEISVQDTFPDGVWWVELAALLNPKLVPQSIAIALRLRAMDREPSSQTLAHHLQGRHLLLVLDNCEHLVHETARLCEHLLSSCPRVKIVTTSREALAIGAEHIWPVPPLTIPLTQQPIAAQAMLEFEAIRLFINRAQAVEPTFQLTERNAPAVLQICEHLDGVPLAIELAAARVKVLTVEQIAVRLEDRFSLLTTGSRTALPRHQTLRAAIDWSYELLAPKERTLFNRLAVFSGGWTLEAAEVVCSDAEIEVNQVLDLLSRLKDKSLVTTQEHRGAVRYNLLETIRAYSHEKLAASGEAQVFQERHLDFFLKLAKETYDRYPLRFYQERMLKRTFSGELDNFRAALAWSLGGADLEKGVQFAAGLVWFWNISSFTSEGNEWLTKALATGNRVSPMVRAKALVVATFTHSHRGMYDEAIAFGNECVRICRELGNERLLVNALRALARALLNQGDLPGAGETAEECMALCRGPERERARVDCLTILAAIRQMQEDAEGSFPILEECLAVSRRLEDEDGIYLSLGMLGRAHMALGDYAKARLLYNQYMAFNWENGWSFRLTYGLEFNAILATLEGQSERAARLWGAAHELRQVSGVPRPRMHDGQYTEYERIARSQLDEETYSRFYKEGAEMPLEQAVNYALADPIPLPVYPNGEQSLPAKSAAQNLGGLTGREHQVALLVAQGKSNRQIAQDLVLSERTVENHVGSIFSKLDFHSRAQIAAWAVETGFRKNNS